MSQCLPPHPHVRTGNYFIITLCPGALPFHQGNMNQAFNLLFPPTISWLWAPFPCPLC